MNGKLNEKLNIQSIRQLLNISSARLDQPVMAQLREVRSQALAHYEECCSKPVLAWAGATNSGHITGTYRSSYFYYCAITILLAAVLSTAGTYWQHAAERDNSELDIAILTDEMPIDVYVD